MKKKILVGVVVLLLLGALGSVFGSTDEKSETSTKSTEGEYSFVLNSDLLKYRANLKGKKGLCMLNK
ncbi:MAG: hypothetical protein E7280_03300 [Lachnospiraceae bacterium]|nr:hypothetical protein [Lachnospiraceae bacterium]